MENKQDKMKIDKKYIDEDLESKTLKEKELIQKMNLSNINENPFIIKHKTGKKSIIDTNKKVIHKDSKESMKTNKDNKNDNLMDCLHLLQFIDKDNKYIENNQASRPVNNYDINEVTMDFLNSDQKREEFTFTNLGISKIPEYLYFCIEINQFFDKQSEFMIKNKLFSQYIAMSRIVIEKYKKNISEKVDTINNISELQDILVSEINSEAELLDLNYMKNKEKKNQDLLNANFAKKGLNGLNNVLQLKIQGNSNQDLFNHNSI